MPARYGCSDEHVAHATCYRTREAPALDGRLGGPWTLAPRSPRFVDLTTGAPGPFDTRAAVLWVDQHLYCGFWIEEPFVRATLTERDSLIFNDNDVEVFIDGGDCYYELETNALGTLYEVLFVWKDAYRKGSRFDVPELDVHARNALTFAGDYDRRAASFWRGTHPRGPRWAFLDWDLPGLRSAVNVDAASTTTPWSTGDGRSSSPSPGQG